MSKRVWIGITFIVFVMCMGNAQRVFASNVSGTLVIVTSFPPTLFEKFKNAFEQKYSDVTVFVRSKKTSAAISFINERVNEPADLFWASAPDAFEVLKEAGHLQRAFLQTDEDGARIGSYPIDDPDGFYRGFAVSGYGIVWHQDYLKRLGLKAPENWRDLTDPSYAHHIGISAPSRSGTTHLIVESILQSQGWENGWATLSEIGGNLATVTARSFGVIDGVLAERFGIGAAIDFLGMSAKATGSPVDFAYPAGTAFLPANIAIVKRSTNPIAAKAFVDFVLSDQGQMLLFDPEISRLPVMQSLYESAPAHFANPFGDELTNKGIAFDAQLSRQRYQLVNSMFDVMITFRLQALRRTWKVIHDAEEALKNVNAPHLVEQVKEARRLASQVPVSADDAASSELSAVFVRHKPGLSVPFRQIKLESEWATFARDHQDRAHKLASDALNALQAQTTKSRS
ncbi:ABC transporter substrate-binding protein [Magnetovibrio sp.]|uniref:ABC transporter substrate-binding protein n=1 Tax=Magnetovibrio sp. TaxID=2024836 RepID=UPI002F93DD17